VVIPDMDGNEGEIKVPHNSSKGLKIFEEENIEVLKVLKTAVVLLMDVVAAGSS
jgi:hypothetical protein